MDWEDLYDMEPYLSSTSNGVWEDMRHNETPIKELETSHLVNIIRGIERGKSYYGQENKLPNLKRELNKRKKI